VSRVYVADVGNTRIKWACIDSIDEGHAVPENEADWQRQLPDAPGMWWIASVRPERSARLAQWLQERGHTVEVIRDARQVPLALDVEFPERVGIDRVLNALAARSRLAPGESATLIDAGSAVTVDWLDESQVFRGGAIFPGLDLMADALHRYTALLPRVEVAWPLPSLPGRETQAAIQRGIYHAVIGGIKECSFVYKSTRTFLTGGQAPLLAPGLPEAQSWPSMTLVGVAEMARRRL
jgi:type III pantothenate kinase